MKLNFPSKYKWIDICKYGLFLRSYVSKTKTSKIERIKCSKSPIGGNLTSNLQLLPQQYKTNRLLGLAVRCYSSTDNEKNENKPPSNKLPELMEFPKIVWPSMFKSMRSFFLTTFIIKPYLDSEFNLPDFVEGSQKAVEVISYQSGMPNTLQLHLL